MNKLSIAKLETARRNPTEFANSLLEKSAQGGFGYPKSLRWLDAIVHWHGGTSKLETVKELEEAFSKRKPTKKNNAELADFISALDRYFKEFTRRDFHLVKSRERISLTLNPLLQLSGQIPLIHMKPDGGFAAYFLSDDSSPVWAEELRFPVVQKFIADDLFGCEIESIDVGIVDYYTGEIFEVCYKPNQIKEAMEELSTVGKKIASVLRKAS
jgi:hypothetical protein